MAGELGFFEVRVDDGERGRAFWGGLFGWRFEEGNFPGYYMIPDSVPTGGLNGTGERVGLHVYFDVPDIGAGVERVRRLGGRADEPMEIPSGIFARCVDDQGVEFSLWQERPAATNQDGGTKR